ncbi:unnamed protein product, partial [Polarella glacialis]
EIPEEELEDSEAEDEEDLMEFLMHDDTEQGLALRDALVPHAVRWFTGEACSEDEEEEDGESEGKVEDSEEEDDSDNESDEEVEAASASNRDGGSRGRRGRQATPKKAGMVKKTT